MHTRYYFSEGFGIGVHDIEVTCEMTQVSIAASEIFLFSPHALFTLHELIIIHPCFMQGRLRYNTPALLFLVDLDYELSFS